MLLLLLLLIHLPPLPSSRSLSRQGESIKRSQTNVDAIEGHNVKGKHLLRGMGSLWGGLSNAMGRAPADVDDTVAAKAARREAVAAAAARAAKPGAGAHLSSGAAWVSDKEILDCTLCRKSFGLLIRKHHCRACGKIICKACSETRVILSGGGGDGVKPERVCDACMLGDGISSNTSSSITSSSSSGNNNTRVVGRGGGTTADESGTKNPSAVFSTTTTTTTSPTMKETEEDSLLAAISLNVGRLGEIGRGMGVELTSQDKALDELTESVERAGLGLKRNTKVATKISKS